MPDLPSSTEIVAWTGLLAPGIIILWVRGRFRDASPPPLSEKSVSYIIVSVAYSAATFPLFYADGGVPLPAWLWQFLLYAVTPLTVALALVFFDQSERFYEVTTRLGLRLAHHTPTAWEYAFRRRSPCYVIVHLSDGSVIYGAWREGSFASTTSGDRDLLISQVWSVAADGSWSVIEPARAILISAASIQLVEFIEGG